VLISGKYQSTDFLKKYGGWLAVGVAAMFLLSMTGRR
jgi:hypothetical protein